MTPNTSMDGEISGWGGGRGLALKLNSYQNINIIIFFSNFKRLDGLVVRAMAPETMYI
jgi:hypothetical protein